MDTSSRPRLPPRPCQSARRAGHSSNHPARAGNNLASRKMFRSHRLFKHDTPRFSIHPHWKVPTGDSFPNYYNQRRPESFSCFALPVIDRSPPSELSDDIYPQGVPRMVSPDIIIDDARNDDAIIARISNAADRVKPQSTWKGLKTSKESFRSPYPCHNPFDQSNPRLGVVTPPKSHRTIGAQSVRVRAKSDNDSLAVLRSQGKRSPKPRSRKSDNVTVGFAKVQAVSSCTHADLLKLLQLVQHNAEQSRDLSNLLARFISEHALRDPYDEEFINRDSPRPFIKQTREQPENPGPKIAVAGGDSPSPPRDSRFFGQGHMIDKADVNSEKESNKANNDEKTSNVANVDNVSTLPAPTSALASASHSPAPGSDIVACPVLAFSDSCQYPDLRDEFDLHPGDCAVRSFHSQDPPKHSSGRGKPRRRSVHRDDPIPSREQRTCDCARTMSRIGSPKYVCPGYATCHICPVSKGTPCRHIVGKCLWCLHDKRSREEEEERTQRERGYRGSGRFRHRRHGENRKSKISSLELSGSTFERVQGSGAFDPVQRDGNTMLNSLSATGGCGATAHAAHTDSADIVDDTDHLHFYSGRPVSPGSKDGHKSSDDMTN